MTIDPFADYVARVQPGVDALPRTTTTWRPLAILNFVSPSSRGEDQIVIQAQEPDQQALRQWRNFTCTALDDLARTAFLLSTQQQLPRDSTYDHIQDVVELIRRGTQYTTSDLASLLKTTHAPQDKSEVALLRNALSDLQREGYMHKKAAETLVRLLEPNTHVNGSRPQRTSTPSPQAFNPRISLEPLTETTLTPTPNYAERAQFLQEIFGFSTTIAEQYASVLGIDDLATLYDDLTRRLGDNGASAVLRENPDILRYNADKKMTKYLSALDDVLATKNPPIVDRNISQYARLESLLELKRKLLSGNHHTEPANQKPALSSSSDRNTALLQEATYVPTVAAVLLDIGARQYIGRGNPVRIDTLKQRVRTGIPTELLHLVRPTIAQLIRDGAMTRVRDDCVNYTTDPNNIKNLPLRQYYQGLLSS